MSLILRFIGIDLIKIHRDRSQDVLNLSQKNYILEKFQMSNYTFSITPIIKKDDLGQCPKNGIEMKSIKNISYAPAWNIVFSIEIL